VDGFSSTIDLSSKQEIHHELLTRWTMILLITNPFLRRWVKCIITHQCARPEAARLGSSPPACSGQLKRKCWGNVKLSRFGDYHILPISVIANSIVYILVTSYHVQIHQLWIVDHNWDAATGYKKWTAVQERHFPGNGWHEHALTDKQASLSVAFPTNCGVHATFSFRKKPHLSLTRTPI
jgi:hypothetical protein